MTNEAEERARPTDAELLERQRAALVELRLEKHELREQAIYALRVATGKSFNECEDLLANAYSTAARAASPVSAPTVLKELIAKLDNEPKSNEGYSYNDHAISVLRKKLKELTVAPVSAEQPTKCPTCDSPHPAERHCLVPDHPHIHVDHDWCTDEFHNVAAPSVASEDSATQPVTLAEAINLGRESWQAKHGKCSMCALGDVPVDGLHRGKHKCGNEVGSVFIPGSEDWMRKAAETAAYKLYPPTKYCTDNAVRCNAEAIIREEFAKHYVASQLSTEKK